MTVKCYLAGACRFNPEHKSWREEVKEFDLSNVEWQDPLDRYDGAEEDGSEMTPAQLVKGDLEGVYSSDALLVRRFKGIESWGTVIEAWEAQRNGKFVVLVSPDTDVPEWAQYCADMYASSLEYGVDLIDAFAKVHSASHGKMASPKKPFADIQTKESK